MPEGDDDQLLCDVLIMVTTSSERDQLEAAARAGGLTFQRRRHRDLGRYYALGQAGDNRVNAVQTEMGPLGYGGSASKAIHSRALTGATGLVQVGMGFGVDATEQQLGDVLVSTSLIPYDRRKVHAAGSPPGEVLPIDQIEPGAGAAQGGTVPVAPGSLTSPMVAAEVPDRPYVVDYARAERHRCKDSLLQALLTERAEGDYPHRIFFGGILSGGAQIFSSKFLRELVEGVPKAEDGIIGGDMEGVGLLSVSDRRQPLWIVVKGVSDFADENRDRDIEHGRAVACRNSARFVLNALIRTKIT